MIAILASIARYGLIAFALVFFAASASVGQDAQLRGVVKDQLGGVVRGASVTITRTATGFHRTEYTDSVGRYLFAFLAPGAYNIAVDVQGFQPAGQAGIVLDAGAEIEFDVVIRPAELTEAIEVSVETMPVDETPGVGLVIDRNFLANMPLNGRTLQSLILMTPGVVTASGDGQFSVDGMRTTSNYMTVDGVSANVGVGRTAGFQAPVSPFGRVGPAGETDTNAAGANPAFNGFGGSNDLIQLESVEEVRVQTAASSAQYGRQPGAQIQLVTRSGTNTFTGTAFEYFRNSALDARDWFTSATGTAREPLEHHQFGAVFGGPLLKDRAFFFLSYEGLQSRQPQGARQMRVPALRLRDNPALSPVLQRLIDDYPLPQGAEFLDRQGNPVGAAPFYDASSRHQRSNSYSIKIDRNFGAGLLLSGRWNQGLSASRSFALAESTTNGSDLRTVTLNGRSVISTHLFHELAVNYSGNHADNERELTDRFGVAPIDVRDLVPSFAPESASATVLLPGNAQNYTLGPLVANRQRQWNVVDNLSVSAGRHAWRFGADLRRLTPAYGPTEYRSTASFNSVDALLQNRADQLTIASSDQLKLSIVSFSAYAQDTFRLNDRVTLDYGLRWEVNPAPAGIDKPLFTLMGFPDLRALKLADPGTPLYPTRWTKLAPRIGVAYRPHQRSGRAMVLRASYGLFYDLGTGATATAARMFPYNRSVRQNRVPYPPTDAAAEPAPVLSLDPPYTGQDFTIVDPRNTLPEVHQWSASAQRAFGAGQSITATYTGNAGRRLLRRYFYAFDVTYPVNPAFPLARLNITRNDPGFADSSNYHALQVQYMRRLSRGLQALVNYTLSRATDTGSDDATVNLVNNATAPAFYDGYSRFDRRHTFNAAVTYNVPSPRRWRAVFGDWSTDYNVRIQSAPPLTVTYSYRDPIDAVDYTYRVDLVPGQPLWLDDARAPGGRRLNPAAFAIPASAFGADSRNQVTHGNELRKGVRGFGTWQADFVLRRQVRLMGRPSVELRAEFHNVFNNPNFSQPDASIGTVVGATGQFIPSPLFGRSTQSVAGGSGGPGGGGVNGGLSSTYAGGGARAIQLALRLTF